MPPIIFEILCLELFFLSSMYCYGLFWCLIPFLFLNFGRKTKKEKNDEDVLKEKEKSEREKKAKAEDGDLMELVSKVKRKLALLKENFMLR